jgi:hypothetical protein
MSDHPPAMPIGEPDFVFDSARRQIPRRIVRLKGDEVAEVLATFEGPAVVGSKIHAEVQRLAAEHPGETIALEWLGNLGWQRYVTCTK